MNKKKYAFLISICILINNAPIAVSAYDTPTKTNNQVTTSNSSEKNNDENIMILQRVSVIEDKSVKDILSHTSFSPRIGHSFAFNLSDELTSNTKGKNIHSSNDIREKGIINRGGQTINIQKKYYPSALDGINACLDANGKYKFIDSNGAPMPIEVPSNQHYIAFKNMERFIEEGKIPGVTDKKEAVGLVKKGNLSYDQAKYIANSGLINSLTCDNSGIISTTNPLGISTVLNYAAYSIKGHSKSDTMKAISMEGFQSGNTVFGNSFLMNLPEFDEALMPSEESISKIFGEEVLEELTDSAIKQIGKKGAEKITKQTAKKLGSVISKSSPALTEAIFFAPDVKNLFEMRISETEFVKDLVVASASLAAGEGGGALGGFLGSFGGPLGAGFGKIAGGVLGAGAGSFAANKLADKYTDSDIQKMYKLLKQAFMKKAEQYMITEKEEMNIVEDLKGIVTESLMRDIYQSDNGGDGIDHFLDSVLDPLFEKELRKRNTIETPTEEELRKSLKQEMRSMVYIH